VAPVEIYISRAGERFGPYSLSEVQGYLDNGSIVPTDLAWHQGTTDWVPLSQIDELTIAKPRVPPPPPTSGSSPQTELVLIILLTLVIPLVGIIVGSIRVSQPERRNEGLVLLGISVFLVIVYASLLLR